MAILDVIKYGHPTLRQKAEPVELDEIDSEFIQDMLETMIAKDGVGLAANQVDVKKRIVVIHAHETTHILINPEIVAHSENTEMGEEGCLSLPGLQASVPRFDKVIVKALNEKGEPIELVARGILAVIVQHEIDHLNGILYIDRADLDTLEWLDNEVMSGLPADTSANLPEVQNVYKKIFNTDRQELVYDSQQMKGE